MAQRHAPGGDAPSSTPSDAETARLVRQVHLCQRILHVLTGVMIGAFLLILVLTTFSVGPFVQVVGRALYFLILASAAVSLAAWIVRVRREKHIGGGDGLSSGRAVAP